MDFFNDALVESLHTGRYTCSKCGAQMFFENEWKEVLICSDCGHSVFLEEYGFEDDESYDSLYPTKEEICEE